MSKRYHTILRSRETAGDDTLTVPLKICLNVWLSSHQPYSTHSQNMQTGGMAHGHYYQDFENALEDYIARCGKWGIPPDPEVFDSEGELVELREK